MLALPFILVFINSLCQLAPATPTCAPLPFGLQADAHSTPVGNLFLLPWQPP